MLRAKDIMNGKVTTVFKDTSVQKVCDILIENKVSGLPVVKEGKKLIGFVSERDIIASTHVQGFFKRKAKDIMTKKVFSVKENTLVEEVSRIFAEKPFRYIPVTRKGIVVGMVSRKEVIDKLLGEYY